MSGGERLSTVKWASERLVFIVLLKVRIALDRREVLQRLEIAIALRCSVDQFLAKDIDVSRRYGNLAL
jgi:hypothetical protein